MTSPTDLGSADAPLPIKPRFTPADDLAFKKWNEVKAIIERLASTNSVGQDRIPDEVISKLSLDVCLSLRSAPSETASDDKAPRPPARTLRQVETEIANIAGAAKGLFELLLTASRRTRLAIEFGGIDSGRLEYDLLRLNELIDERRTTWVNAIAFDRSTGRPLKVHTANFTAACGAAYQKITGKAPSLTTNPVDNLVSGPFIEFLSAMFASFGIRASVEAQARALVREWRNRSADLST